MNHIHLAAVPQEFQSSTSSQLLEAPGCFLWCPTLLFTLSYLLKPNSCHIYNKPHFFKPSAQCLYSIYNLPHSIFGVVQSLSHVWLYSPTNCRRPGSSIPYYIMEFAQTYVHWVNDTTEPSHLLHPPSPFAVSLSQHQGLFQWVGSSYQVAKVLELKLQHQSFQRIFKVDFL